jgi:hypothetical protein
MDYDNILENNKLPKSVRYAMLRSEIVNKAKNRNDRRQLLMLVGHKLEGNLQPGKPNYWLFSDNTKAKFQ